MRRREQWDLAIASVTQELGRPMHIHTVSVPQSDHDAVANDQGHGYVANNSAENAEWLEHTQECAPLEGADNVADTELSVHTEDDDLLLEEMAGHIDHGSDSATEDPEVSLGTDTTLSPYEDLDNELSANLESGPHRQKRPSWKTNTGPGLNVKGLPPQSIYATDTFKERYESRRWTPKKLELVTLAMERLQIDFFEHILTNNLTTSAVHAVPAAYSRHFYITKPKLVDIKRRIQKDMRRCQGTEFDSDHMLDFDFERTRGHAPICQYYQDDEGAYLAEQRRVQSALAAFFRLQQSGEIDEAACLARIFHKLSVSTSPPNTDIFNTLINGLRKQGNVFLALRVISAFDKSHMRPNEITMASILEFAAETNNVKLFRNYIQRMRGQGEGANGIILANRHAINRLKLGPLAANGRVIPNDRKSGTWHQLPYPTPIVFSAILRGALHFSGFESALQLYQKMREEGWGIDMIGFGILLRDCAKREDWRSGVALWEQIVALKQKSKRLVDGKWQSDTLTLTAFMDMLHLCTRCKQRRAFEDVLSQVAKTHPYQLHRIKHVLASEHTGGHRSKTSARIASYPQGHSSTYQGSKPLFEATFSSRGEREGAYAYSPFTGIHTEGMIYQNNGRAGAEAD